MKLLPRLLRLAAPLLALGGAPALAAPAAVDADPALWVVKDKDTTIYLFGTVHALDGKHDWFNDEVKSAFDRSNELVLEIVTPEKQEEMLPIISKYGFDTTGRTRTSKLSPKGRIALAGALKRNNMAPTALDKFKPFFASMTITGLEFAKLGMNSQGGAEETLKAAAAAQKKPVSAVETIDYQLGLFDTLPEAEQVRLLEDSIEEIDTLPKEIGKLVSAWSKGDADKVATLMQQADTDSPLLYQRLLVERNRNWAGWIDQRLKQPGTVFLAVGAGHLAGKDSVQQVLKRRHIAARRVAHVE